LVGFSETAVVEAVGMAQHSRVPKEHLAGSVLVERLGDQVSSQCQQAHWGCRLRPAEAERMGSELVGSNSRPLRVCGQLLRVQQLSEIHLVR
jgi:hypothetical protein